MKIKRIIVAMAMASAVAVPVIALGAGPASADSPAGACHGAFANVNGNFGFLGTTGLPFSASSIGGGVPAGPGAAGYNNSVNGGCPLGN